MKKSYFLVLLCTLLTLGANTLCGETVKYTISAKDAVTSSGTAPIGSSASYAQTYNTKGQMTQNNSTTLTLAGYAGYKITGIVLNMKSNAKAGSGTFSAIAGTTTIAAISSATTFNKWYYNTAYSSSYKDVIVTLTNGNHIVQTGENVVIKIAATVNSLYIQSYTITYEEGITKTALSLIPKIGVAPPFLCYNIY